LNKKPSDVQENFIICNKHFCSQIKRDTTITLVATITLKYH